jgi:tellurite resistance protein TehA-like permease
MNASDVKRYLGYGGGVLIIGLMVLGKIKLATMKPVWWVIILGGIVFAISSPASANAQSER